MGLIEKRTMLAALSPPLDHLLATQLLDEFISAERRFIQRDWEPAELDGGQFAEIAARILYHRDSNNLSHTKDFADCLKYVEDDKLNHLIIPRHDALHITRILRNIYKFRSQRGAVHISPSYQANHMDSKFIIEAVRWVMNEILRIFWNGDRERVAKAIRELLQFDVPCVGVFEDVILVQRTDLTADEEILVLLHFGGEQGFSRAQLGKFAKRPASSISDSIKKLLASDLRQIVLVGDKYRLTDLGSRRVREQLAGKLLLQ
ncbi:hypothetical protein [Bradyrhizobium sp. Ce-3]|uniref:hypothetical protein n=1 Tax=Bradyrhizobium sp. Ce-3 TaxID=2913970 RepID=UPI001FBBC26E|nr:hypothetical protein [Bradyrhizobium sp. Ce-3]GKQ51116.1 hypothetical protein BRSPCE3_19710 [Bradyrhizobium sp. Ce-3]